MNPFFLLDWIGGPSLVRAVFWVDLFALVGFFTYLGIRLVRHPGEPSAKVIAAFVLTAFASHSWSFVSICFDRFALNGGHRDLTGNVVLYLTAFVPGILVSTLSAFVPSGSESRRARTFGPLAGLLHTIVLFALAPGTL